MGKKANSTKMKFLAAESADFPVRGMNFPVRRSDIPCSGPAGNWRATLWNGSANWRREAAKWPQN
jgi:hypothetical protein